MTNTNYIGIPKNISYNDVVSNNFAFSAAKYKDVLLKNHNYFFLRDLIKKPVRGKDQEAKHFLQNSPYLYLKTKGINSEKFIIDTETSSACEYLHPTVFKKYIQKIQLKEGDILYKSSGGDDIGQAAIADKSMGNIVFSSHSFKIEPKESNIKFYLLAFLKHKFCSEQLGFMVYRGSTLRRGGTKFLDCKIPFPNQKNKDDVIIYVELLTQSIINKEKEIRKKHKEILKQIEKELLGNQKDKGFNYELPNFKEIKNSNRVDAGYYCKDYQEKQYLIKNYKNGAKELMSWGYSSKRGQNLQVSQIGKSIYSDIPKGNFYTLIRPTNFSEFGTIEKFEYLGNAKELFSLEAGDIVFSAEGTIGKCILFTNPKSRWITNIHGIVLKKKEQNIIESAFVSCFLRFLRNFGTLDYISVGGQGGSLAKKYWKDILIPNFSKQKQKDIAFLYHNQIDYPQLDLQIFLESDKKWNEQSGIIELDKSAKLTKKLLNEVLDKVVNDEVVEIKFDKLRRV